MRAKLTIHVKLAQSLASGNPWDVVLDSSTMTDVFRTS